MNQLTLPYSYFDSPHTSLNCPPTSLNCPWGNYQNCPRGNSKEWWGKKNSISFGREHCPIVILYCPLRASLNFEIAPAEKKASDASDGNNLSNSHILACRYTT